MTFKELIKNFKEQIFFLKTLLYLKLDLIVARLSLDM